jgi:hypothetical protein
MTLKKILEQEMEIAIKNKVFDALITDHENFLMRPADFEKYYKLESSNLTAKELSPTTGWQRKPMYLFIRK